MDLNLVHNHFNQGDYYYTPETPIKTDLLHIVPLEIISNIFTNIRPELINQKIKGLLKAGKKNPSFYNAHIIMMLKRCFERRIFEVKATKCAIKISFILLKFKKNMIQPNIVELINLSYEMVLWFENFELSKKIYLEAFSQIAFNMSFGPMSNVVDKQLAYFFSNDLKFNLEDYYQCFNICPIWEHTKAINQFQEKFKNLHKSLNLDEAFEKNIKKKSSSQFLVWIDLFVNLLRSICYPDWEIFLAKKIPVSLFAKWLMGGEELKIVYEFVNIFIDRCEYPWEQVCEQINSKFVLKQIDRFLSSEVCFEFKILKLIKYPWESVLKDFSPNFVIQCLTNMTMTYGGKKTLPKIKFLSENGYFKFFYGKQTKTNGETIEEELVSSNKLKNFFSEEIFFEISDLIGRELYLQITPEIITDRIVNSVTGSSVIENIKKIFKEKKYGQWERVYEILAKTPLYEIYFTKNHNILADLHSLGYKKFTTSQTERQNVNFCFDEIHQKLDQIIHQSKEGTKRVEKILLLFYRLEYKDWVSLEPILKEVYLRITESPSPIVLHLLLEIGNIYYKEKARNCINNFYGTVEKIKAMSSIEKKHLLVLPKDCELLKMINQLICSRPPKDFLTQWNFDTLYNIDCRKDLKVFSFLELPVSSWQNELVASKWLETLIRKTNVPTENKNGEKIFALLKNLFEKEDNLGIQHVKVLIFDYLGSPEILKTPKNFHRILKWISKLPFEFIDEFNESQLLNNLSISKNLVSILFSKKLKFRTYRKFVDQLTSKEILSSLNKISTQKPNLLSVALIFNHILFDLPFQHRNVVFNRFSQVIKQLLDSKKFVLEHLYWFHRVGFDQWDDIPFSMLFPFCETLKNSETSAQIIYFFIMVGYNNWPSSDQLSNFPSLLTLDWSLWPLFSVNSFLKVDRDTVIQNFPLNI